MRERERARTHVRVYAIAYLLSEDRRPNERANERWAAAGPAVQRCLRSRNLTNRFRFRRRELASSIMATRGNVRPSPPVRGRQALMIRLTRAYVKANLHGSLGTIIPEGSCPAYGDGKNSSLHRRAPRPVEGSGPPRLFTVLESEIYALRLQALQARGYIFVHVYESYRE